VQQARQRPLNVLAHYAEGDGRIVADHSLVISRYLVAQGGDHARAIRFVYFDEGQGNDRLGARAGVGIMK